jgi:hypothetical protein
MTAAARARTGTITRWQAAAWSIAALVVLIFAAANAHLVFVATTSQPACVPHARLGAAAGALSAAQSSCESPAQTGPQPREGRP